MFDTVIGAESPLLEEELRKGGSRRDMREEYFQAAKRVHPDRPDGELLEIADRIVKAEGEGKRASVEDYLEAARGDGT